MNYLFQITCNYTKCFNFNTFAVVFLGGYCFMKINDPFQTFCYIFTIINGFIMRKNFINCYYKNKSCDMKNVKQ